MREFVVSWLICLINPFLANLVFILLKKLPTLRHHYRARNWTFEENSFLVSSESSIRNGSMGESRQKEIRWEVGLKCHQSCLVALAFCTKLYIKLAFSLCSFSQKFFLLTFERLKPGLEIWSTFSLSSFLQYLVSDFWYLFSFKSYSPFCTKNGPNLTCRRVFQHNFILKANLKNPEQGFLVDRLYQPMKQKWSLWQVRCLLNLKALDFGAIFASFDLFRYLKVVPLFQNCAETFRFQQAFKQKKTVWR